MNESEVAAHYKLALEIISGTSPESDSVEDLKKWYGCIKLLATNAILQNSLDLEFEEALKTSAKQKANAGRTLRVK